MHILSWMNIIIILYWGKWGKMNEIDVKCFGIYEISFNTCLRLAFKRKYGDHELFHFIISICNQIHKVWSQVQLMSCMEPNRPQSPRLNCNSFFHPKGKVKKLILFLAPIFLHALLFFWRKERNKQKKLILNGGVFFFFLILLLRKEILINSEFS